MKSHGRRAGGPRSWRTRAARAWDATGWSDSEIFARIMKHTYPDQGSPPKWAQLAYDRHWITLAELVQIPLEGTGSIFEMLYTDSPFLRIIKKTWAPYDKSATAAG